MPQQMRRLSRRSECCPSSRSTSTSSMTTRSRGTLPPAMELSRRRAEIDIATVILPDISLLSQAALDRLACVRERRRARSLPWADAFADLRQDNSGCALGDRSGLFLGLGSPGRVASDADPTRSATGLTSDRSGGSGCDPPSRQRGSSVTGCDVGYTRYRFANYPAPPQRCRCLPVFQ